MKIVNKSNIPEEIFNLLKQDMYDRLPKENTISATGLLKPTREIILTERHYSEIEVDAIDRLWALFGSGIHAVLENAKLEGHNQKEERLKHKYGGYEVSGKFDLIRGTRLKDYKTTSAWTMVFGDRKDEWKKQMSIYRTLYHKVYNIELDNTVNIIAIFRDWNKRDAERVNNYPQSPAMVIDIELDSIKDTDTMINNKILSLTLCKNIPDSELPLCTNEERWFNKAKKTFNKCEKYCSAYMFCNQALGKGDK